MKETFRFIVSFVAVTAIVAVSLHQRKRDLTWDLCGNASEKSMKPAAREADSTLTSRKSDIWDNMRQPNKTGNTEHNLAAIMREHHKGIIILTSLELQKCTSDDLKAMAQKIQKKLLKETAELDKVVRKYGSGEKGHDPANIGHGSGKAMSDNITTGMVMTSEKVVDVDQGFALMMVKQYAEGIRIGKIILLYAKDRLLLTMTEKMIAEQQKEINEFQKWLSANGHK